MTPNIVLHIGAHKTATTHLQRSILASRKELWDKGVKVFGPPQLRGEKPTLLRRFDLPGCKDGLGDPQASLSQMLGGGHRLVLSEENLIGSLINRYGKLLEPIYPDASLRIADLASKIAPDGIDICLGVRQPTTYLNSAFGQYLMSGGSVPLEKFLWKNPPRIVNWVDLVQRLHDTPGVRSIIVWRHEDYRLVFDQVVEAMLGAESAEMVSPVDDIVHRGISEEAVKYVEKLHADGATGDFWTYVRTAFPIALNNPAFNAFGKIEHSTSRVAYSLQMRQIASMERVKVLEPKA